KSGGSRFGADCASGVPSQLISRRPAAAGGLLRLSGSPSRPRNAVTVGVRPAASPAAPPLLGKEEGGDTREAGERGQGGGEAGDVPSGTLDLGKGERGRSRGRGRPSGSTTAETAAAR